MPNTRSSRIPGFYRLNRQQRLRSLIDAGFLSEESAAFIASTGSALDFDTADQMIENAIGVFELPIGVGLNLRVNDRDYAVPMVIEEPSVVAALSHTAKLIRDAGGFTASADRAVMISQVQVVGLEDLDAAADAVRAAETELVELANLAEPGMLARGGGALGVEARLIRAEAGSRYGSMLILHLLVDCVDAMGANTVNSMAEAIAPRVEGLTGGRVFLRILSNLADRRMARAGCRIPFDLLAWRGYSGAAVADGVVAASKFAELDPYRAATHNKGIFNGIDAVALATGQDWRAIESGGHSHAGNGDRYSPLAVWWIEEEFLCGSIELPMALGTVGGPIKLHPTVKVLFGMLNVSGAAELAQVFAACGLAQNLGALKALGTEGINRGHMSLHARSVAATAGATGAEVEEIARRLVDSGEIKVERATQELVALRDE